MNGIKADGRARRRAWLAGATFLVVLLGVGSASLVGCYEGEDFEQAKAYRIDSESQLIGGATAHGELGDYLLENDKIRIVLSAQATDASVNKYGGSLLDADIVRFENHFDPMTDGHDSFLQLTPVFDLKSFGLETFRNSAPLYKASQESFEILSDGAGGGAAVIRVTGVMEELIEVLKFIPVPLTSLPIRAETTYTLRPGNHYVEITTVYTLLERDLSEPEQIVDIPTRALTADDNPLINIFTGDALGDGIFFGDSVDVFGPGEFAFASDWWVEESYDRGRSTILEPPALDWIAGVNEHVGYAVVADDGPISLPIMESFLTIGFSKVAEPGNAAPLPGSRYTYTRYFVVDDGDLAGLLEHVIDIRGWRSGTVQGNVVSAADGKAVSGAQVFVFPHPHFTADGSLVPVEGDYDAMTQFLQELPDGSVDFHRLVPYSRFTTDSGRFDAAGDGSFQGKLPVDDQTDEQNWILMAVGPGPVRSRLVPIRLTDGETQKVGFVLPQTGTIRYDVRSLDPAGPHEPCKVTVRGINGEGVGDPWLGENFTAFGVARIEYPTDGQGEVTVPPGRYEIYASRGPEYTLDEQVVEVRALETAEVQLEIDRVVDTSGWIAGDFHLHCENSPDAGLDIESRVRSILAEGLDIVAATDHDYITDYRPTLEALGMRDRLTAMAGDELSHLGYAHVNGYPLRQDPDARAMGAPDWRQPSFNTYLDNGQPAPTYTPQDVFDALRMMTSGEIDQPAFVTANHTQESITGYLRSFGFRQFYGTFEEPFFLTLGDPTVNGSEPLLADGSKHFSWDFDAIELINGKRFDDQRTATEEEIPSGQFGQPRAADIEYLPLIVRTGDEQARILTGELEYDSTERGMVEDYFTLLAMGRRYAGTGTSDSHTASGSQEAGKGRTWVMSQTDDPRFIDLDQTITNMRKSRIIASTGPFVEAWVNGRPIGSDVHDADGTIQVRIKAQAPPWMSLDRLEIYGNGVLIGEIGADSGAQFLGCFTDGMQVAGIDEVIRFEGEVSCMVSADTFVNVIAIGYQGMDPVSLSTFGPTRDLLDSILVGVDNLLEQWVGVRNVIPLSPRVAVNHAIYPYAITNAIWVDVDGVDADLDGHDYDGPGFVPGWFEDEFEEMNGGGEKSGEIPADLIPLVTAARIRMWSLMAGGHGEGITMW